MRLFLVLIAGFLVHLFPMGAWATTGCLPNENYVSHEFSGEVWGDEAFSSRMGIYTLKLDPVHGGWQIKVFRASGPEVPIRYVSQGLPPKPSSQLFGMDFVYDVNTQYREQGRIYRHISFGPATPFGEVSDPDNIVPGRPRDLRAATVEPGEGDNGIGEIFIHDYGLAEQFEDMVPRVNYLKFSGCLGWDQGYRGSGWRDMAEPSVPDESVAAMQHCGFGNYDYTLTERTMGWGEGGAPYLEPDLMGDGVLDFVAAVRRNSDDAEGLAICLRGDNRLQWAGFDDGDIEQFTKKGDFWRVNKGPFKPGSGPQPVGDAIVMGAYRGPSILIYMDESEALNTQRRGG